MQVGYWNEEEKYVTTASFMRGSNDTYGLQNRTYIVTTILVSRSQIDRLGDVMEDKWVIWERPCSVRLTLFFFILLYDRVLKIQPMKEFSKHL